MYNKLTDKEKKDLINSMEFIDADSCDDVNKKEEFWLARGC